MKKALTFIFIALFALFVFSSCGEKTPASCQHKNIRIDKGYRATCEEKGKTDGKVCLDCGVVLQSQQPIKKKDHEYELINSTPACDGEGEATYKCEECGDKYTESLPAGTHILEFFEAVQEATCLENGIEIHKCKYCDHTEEKELPPLGHQLDDGVKNDGFLVKSCTRDGCEYKEFEEIIGDSDSDTSSDSNNDSSTDSDSSSDSSSDTNGSSSDTETEVDPDDCEHDWQFVSSTATCTKDGVAVYACSICYEMMSSKDEALGHDMQFSYTVDPTCAEGGYDLYRCARGCGETEERNPTPVTSIHTWAILDVDLPTCEENGLITFECSVCFTEKDSTYEELANGLPEEQVLAETIMALGHDFSVYESEIPATCTESGYTTYSCSRECGKTETIVNTNVPIGHLYENSYQCSRCNYFCKTPSEGLVFTKNTRTQTYYVSSIGTCEDSDVVIPYTYNGTPVTGISERALASNDKMVTLTIPSSITELERGAIASCINLTSVEYYGGCNITAMGTSAFYDCSSLKTAEIPEGISTVPAYVFQRCTSLTEVVIHNGITKIETYAFDGCSNLLSVTVGSSVTIIGSKAFTDCKILEIYNLSQLPISTSNTTSYGGIGTNALVVRTSTDAPSILDKTDDGYVFIYYNGTNSLVGYTGDCEEISLPESYKGGSYAIYAYALYSSKITKLSIPKAVTSIGKYAFSECKNLIEVYYNASNISDLSNTYIFDNSGKSGDGITLTVGKDVLTLPQYIFCSENTSTVSKLTTVNFESGGICQAIGEGAFYYCTYLKSTEIPGNVSIISDYAFNGCSSLENVKISAGVSEIGRSAFQQCSSLATIVIPSSVTTLGNYAFKDSTNLVIYCETQSQPAGWNSYWNSGKEQYTYWYAPNRPSASGQYWHYVNGVPTKW